MRTRACVLLVVVAVVAAGCSGNGPQPAGSTEAVARYGLPASPDPDGVTYQPDVVVVEGGADRVRSVSADGLRWTIDRHAPGVADLEFGKVMFLTSRAAGRVAAIEPAGELVTVTLAPVQLTEIIRDGHLKVDTAIDLDGATVQRVPGMPGAHSAPTREEENVTGRPIGFSGGGGVEFADSQVPGLPLPSKGAAKVALGEWEGAVSVDKKGLGLQVSYKPSKSFKVGIEVSLGLKDLRMVMDTVIRGGVVRDVTAVVHGLDHLDVNLFAGTALGAGENRKVKIEFPIELINEPFMAGELPMVLNVKTKIIVATALSGKNSTLTAAGRWALRGPLGVSGGKLQLPKWSLVKPMLDSIGGIAIGPSGIVVGSEWRFMFGVGVPAINAGPYAKLRYGLGVVNGSALGASVARCTQVDLKIEGGYGFGLNIDAKTYGLVRKLTRLPIKSELELEKVGVIRDTRAVRPDVALCKAGG